MTRPRSRSLSRFLPAFVTTLLAGVSLSGPAPKPAHAQTWAESDGAASLAITSGLDRRVRLPGFGNIAYRAPLVGKRGPVVVLVHGIFAGSTHRSFNELLPLLDAADARVYTLDLPGTGESESPKRAYSMAVLDQFVETFLDQVVREPATLVAESLLTGSALQVAALRPDRVKRLVLLSPTGAVNLASPPSRDATSLYDTVYGNDFLGLLFYSTLLSDPSLRFFLERTFADRSLVTDTLLDEYRLARSRPNQRWISFSFVGGQLHRRFADVAPAVAVPVLALFGKQAESPGPVGRADAAADFSAIRPDFTYREIDRAGLNLHREQPTAVARQILDFIK
ncbi:MAG TPA: alpha/beta fold hydrolase [Pseudomonadota bacterium]|nr:alpha/beta fold hydrolase [Pseudomonadota bacterium]